MKTTRALVITLGSLICTVILRSAPAVGAENLLKNAGFEEIGSDGVPAAWQREFNPALTGPFKVVDDARGGKKAVQLMTEEWLLDRPQFIIQDIKLPKGAKASRLAAWCKGQGLIRLCIQFTKDGKPLKAESVKQYYGTYIVPEETEKVFGLGAVYREYEVFAEVPEGADGVRARIGNTIGDTANVWGTAWVDDVTFAIADKVPAPMTAPTHEIMKKIGEVAKDCTDITRYAQVTTDPPSLNTQNLFDGRLGFGDGTLFSTMFCFMRGSERYPSVTLTWPVALPVNLIYLHLRGNVEVFDVYADTTGAGVCNEQVACVQGMKGVADWVAIKTDGKPVHALRLQPIEGRLRGYRGGSIFIDELKVACSNDAFKAQEATLRAKAVYGGGAPGAAAGLSQASLRRIRMDLPENKDVKRFGKCMISDFWNFGINAKGEQPIDFSKSPNIQAAVDLCQRVGFDSIEIFHESVDDSTVPWESKICKSAKHNYLKGAIEALHANGLKVYVMPSITYNPPYSGHLYLYPKEESSRYPQIRQYPSVLFGDQYRDTWLGLLEEVMACGSDGVAVCPDEQYYKGHFMATFPKDDPARELYRKRFGHDLPKREEDTLAFRQWIMMRHEAMGDLYGYWTKRLKEKHPNIWIGTRFMQCGDYINETGIPLDVLGARGGITEMSSDYLGPYGIQMQSAANGWRRSAMCFDASISGPMNGSPRKSDITICGEICWGMMYGLGAIEIYRQSYIVDQGTLPGFMRGFNMLSELEALGIYDARPPKKIALLSSRSSLDWWQIKSWWGKDADPNHDRAVEAMRPNFAEQAVYNILQQNGQSFDWFFLDRPDQLKNLEDYKVLVIPFAYSVSKAAAERVQAAVAKGAKVIFFDGKLGPTDEWGEPYAKPAFQDLADSGKAQVFAEDILRWGSTDVFARKAIKSVFDALGDDAPFKITARCYDGSHVDAAMLEKGPREKFVFLINWEKAYPMDIDLNLNLPEGTYEVLVRDLDFWYRMSLNGKTALTREDLKKFHLWMVPETAYVLCVRPAK